VVSYNRQVSIIEKRADRRSIRTRRALRDALEALLAARPVKAITVSALAEKADINRATFYLHYRSPRDLILETAQELLADLAGSFRPVEADNLDLDRPPEHIVKVFRHVRAHAALYRTIFGGTFVSPFHPRFMAPFNAVGMRRISEVTRTPKRGGEMVERELVVSATVGAVLGVINWWLATGMRRSPEYMAERIGWLLVSGSYPLLGLTPPRLA
jgi:AcrR family transcriptional regulator